MGSAGITTATVTLDLLCNSLWYATGFLCTCFSKNEGPERPWRYYGLYGDKKDCGAPDLGIR